MNSGPSPPDENLRCLHCGKIPLAVNAFIDNSKYTMIEQKLQGNVRMGWECTKCFKLNYFKVRWEPFYDKFIT